jgi:hypothetical protein
MMAARMKLAHWATFAGGLGHERYAEGNVPFFG